MRSPPPRIVPQVIVGPHNLVEVRVGPIDVADLGFTQVGDANIRIANQRVPQIGLIESSAEQTSLG